jgi:alkylation response protein AidB-like acyl-CoA dehydrogenase
MHLLGSEALLYDTLEPGRGAARPDQWLQRALLGSRAASIASGTTEIMKGIIAMQVLGLPRG